jgi:hypothetical protein
MGLTTFCVTGYFFHSFLMKSTINRSPRRVMGCGSSARTPKTAIGTSIPKDRATRTLEDGTSIEEAKQSYEDLKAELNEVLASPTQKEASDPGRPAARESP